MINGVEPKIVSLLQRTPDIAVRNVSGRGHYYMVARCDTAPFDNNDLRMALKYAVDREAFVNTILGGYGKVGNDTPVNAAYPLFSAEIEQRVYDPRPHSTTGNRVIAAPSHFARRTWHSQARSMPHNSTSRAL